MGKINVSRVASNSKFLSEITVERKSGSWQDGRYVPGAPETFRISAIVTVLAPDDLMAVPEADRTHEVMRFITKMELQLTREGTNQGVSDVIVYDSRRYRVIKSSNDSGWGYWRTLAVRMEANK